MLAILKKHTTFIYLAGILLITITIYWSSLSNGMLYWDDYYQILNNFFVQQPNLANLKRLIALEPNELGMYQPLTTILFSIEKNIFQASWTTFHFFSLLWHLLNVLLVYLVLNQLSKQKYVALLATCFFAIAPVNVEAVAWISARSTLVFSSFSLMSLLSYIYLIKAIKNNQAKSCLFFWYLLSLATFILAILAKTPAVIIVPLLFVLDYIRIKRPLNCLVRMVPYLIISILFISVAYYIRHVSHEMPTEMPNYSFWQYVVINLSGFMIYLIKIFLPISATGLEPYPVLSHGQLDWSYYFGALTTLSIMGLILYFKKITPLFLSASAFFSLLLVFTKWDNSSTPFIADRYLYLSSIPCFFILGLVILNIQKRWHLSKYIFIVFILYLCILTNTLTKYWKNDYSFWNFVINSHSEFARAYSNRAFTLMLINKYQLALDDYKHCSQLEPKNIACLGNQGIILLDIFNKPQEALAIAEKTSLMNPLNGSAYYRIALSKKALLDYDGARLALKKALKTDKFNQDFLDLDTLLNPNQ